MLQAVRNEDRSQCNPALRLGLLITSDRDIEDAQPSQTWTMSLKAAILRLFGTAVNEAVLNDRILLDLRAAPII